MTDRDLLHRFIFDKIPIRGEFIKLQASYQTIVSQHPYPEPLRQLLGEALCVAGLLSAIIKFNGRLTVQFRGEGNLKLLLAQCDNEFRVRGLAKWEGEMSYGELMEAFNNGILVITLDSRISATRYQGIVKWRGNSLTESIEGYFQDSEQLATKLWLSVGQSTAAGFLLQAIPVSKKETLPMEEQVMDLHWERIVQQTNLIKPDEMINLPYSALLNKLYPDEMIKVFPDMPVIFECGCSQKRSEDAILVLGQKEVEEELKNNRSIEVTCDFCNKKYLFDRVDIAKLFKDHDTPPSSLH